MKRWPPLFRDTLAKSLSGGLAGVFPSKCGFGSVVSLARRPVLGDRRLPEAVR